MGLSVPDELRCVDTTVKGTRCLRQRLAGSDFCEKHPIRARVEVPAQRPVGGKVAAEARALAVVAAAGVAVPDVDHLEPVEVMAWVVLKSKAITEALVARLEDGRDMTHPDEAGLIRGTLEALGHVRKAAEAAESAGMQRRRVVLEEAKVQAAWGAIDRAILRAGLDGLQEARLRGLIGEELAAAGRAA